MNTGPSDYLSFREDHAADCDRYFLLSLHERIGEKPLTEIEKKLKRLKEKEEKVDLQKLYFGEYHREEMRE